ncbi:MAG: shikimate dehydrogenase [Pseudorhodoplanes sp.]|nr:shikimate dehydrogenase [Pseudorhodoplanes sp.]
MSEASRAACVIGWPVAHSRSPMIHNYWIRQHGIAGEYRREAVTAEDFVAFASDLAGHGYAGANITIPHKEAALAISQPDDRAKAVGAANTLWLDNGALRSTNTDVEGFLDNLDASAPGWDRELETALVLGAGGAARAIVFGLLGRGAKAVYVANRTLPRARALRERFGSAVHPVGWDEVGGLLASAGLLVNTTSLGMHGQPPLSVKVDDLPASAVVADIVYVPLETELLAAARRRGLRTADGLGMLLYQAVRAFSLFFGVRPEVTPELRAMVETDLQKGK